MRMLSVRTTILSNLCRSVAQPPEAPFVINNNDCCLMTKRFRQSMQRSVPIFNDVRTAARQTIQLSCYRHKNVPDGHCNFTHCLNAWATFCKYFCTKRRILFVLQNQNYELKTQSLKNLSFHL
jgi:hypothetical protein